MSIKSEIRALYREWFPEKPFGLRGEQVAERFLRRKGMRIIERGYHNHIGEIDLIVVEAKKTVAFVEVKTRESDRKGLPVEAVDERKQHQIVQTALVFLADHDLLESPFRFDVVGILWPPGEKPVVDYFPDAFQPRDVGQMFS